MPNKTLHYLYFCLWLSLSCLNHSSTRCTQIYYITERLAQVTLSKTPSVQLKSKRPHETHTSCQSSHETDTHQLVFTTESSSKIYFKRPSTCKFNYNIQVYESRLNVCSQSQQQGRILRGFHHPAS